VVDANGDGVNNDGAAVVYNGTSTPDIEPDQIVFVTIELLKTSLQMLLATLRVMTPKTVATLRQTLIQYRQRTSQLRSLLVFLLKCQMPQMTVPLFRVRQHRRQMIKTINMRFQALVWNTQLQRQYRR